MGEVNIVQLQAACPEQFEQTSGDMLYIIFILFSQRSASN